MIWTVVSPGSNPGGLSFFSLKVQTKKVLRKLNFLPAMDAKPHLLNCIGVFHFL
jgi:hypothetical protein